MGPYAPGTAGRGTAPAEPAERAKDGERASDVSSFLEAAKKGDSPEVQDFIQGLPSRFDGLSGQDREDVLQGLEGLVKAEPKNTGYRATLQGLIVRDELEKIEPKLRGVDLTPARKEEVLGDTSFRDIKWYHRFTGVVHPEAEGVTSPDNTISLHVKSGWQRMTSFVGHFRALFSHEYTHRLQNEGEMTGKLGIEIPAVATELLRGIELFGLEGLRQGSIGFIGPGQLWSFDKGRQWMASSDERKASDKSGFYWKGFLAGAAFELAQRTGQWADAWAYHRRVSSGADPLRAEAELRAAASK